MKNETGKSKHQGSKILKKKGVRFDKQTGKKKKTSNQVRKVFKDGLIAWSKPI